MEKKVTSVILAGVGGQGVLLAARVLSEVAFRSGFDVKSSEVHGMAQRGGSVLSQVRFGRRVYSPLTPRSGADYLLALEELKALRYRFLVRKKGLIIFNRHRIFPASVSAGRAIYPASIESTLQKEGYSILPVDSGEITARLNNPRSANVFCLGILSRWLPFKPERWKKAICDSVRPAFRKQNWEAFELGRNTT